MRFQLILAVSLVAVTAHARLGDSITDCDQQYNGGKPGQPSAADRLQPLVTGPNTTNLSYLYRGMTVRVGFRNSTAAVVEYSKTGMSRLTDAEIDGILNDNGGGWDARERPSRNRRYGVVDASSDSDDSRSWTREDDGCSAALQNAGRCLQLKSREAAAPRGSGPQAKASLLGCLVTECDARIGGGRPGNPSAEDRLHPLVSGPGTTNLTYMYKGLTARVGFKSGQASVIEFTKLGTAKLTSAEVGQLMDELGGEWNLLNKYASEREWPGMSEHLRAADDGRVWFRNTDYSVAYLSNLNRTLRAKLKAYKKPDYLEPRHFKTR